MVTESPRPRRESGGRLRDWHRPLLIAAGLMFGVALVSLVGILVDDRTLFGESVWVKPLKFGFAFATYAATLAWLLPKLRKARRFGWWCGLAFGIGTIVDVPLIAIVAARGSISHFNQTAEPFNQAVQQILPFGILAVFLANLIIAILLLVQRVADRPLNLALRVGVVLATYGMSVPIWLADPKGATPRTVPDANGDPVRLMGGHGVGDLDGHGMPITNWSLSGGDFRVPHFLGLHGIQVLLLFVLLLTALAARWVWLRDEKTRARLVGVAAFGYAGLTAILSWQAGRGQSLVHPDAATLTALSVLVVVTLILGAAALRRRLRGSGAKYRSTPGTPAPVSSRSS